jgi:hypothetical protein
MPHVSYAVLRTWDLAAVSAAVAGLGPVVPVELTWTVPDLVDNRS